MNIAALPNHNGLADPLWLKLFHGYRHVIAPLRHNGWVTDMETGGGENYIRAELGDGTELSIASVRALPVDPNEVTGWTVIRRHVEDVSRHTVLYDSTPGGPQGHHGNSLIPMFARIDALDALTFTRRLIVSATHVAAFSGAHNQTAGIETPGTAVARYFEWTERLVSDEGYRCVWERPESEGFPLALFENVGNITSVRVTRSHD
ncbi:hypothetical protein ACFU99_19045 [Streptomyces sp. NPDC057654]|uniref:hypothetical protein n=1 Tax=Streptomyces sp. NPDC057654 TaxID=3346196 RepID=UPI0036D01AF5